MLFGGIRRGEFLVGVSCSVDTLGGTVGFLIPVLVVLGTKTRTRICRLGASDVGILLVGVTAWRARR
jgi:hypothetical protein